MAWWFLPEQAIEKNENFSLFTSSDIEDCLKFLQKPGVSISISQLGEGQCRSKVQVLDFGCLLLMVENHSHVIEVNGNIPSDSFMFAFGLDPRSTLIVDGTGLGSDILRISPAFSDCFEVFRPGGAIALLAVNAHALLDHESPHPRGRGLAGDTRTPKRVHKIGKPHRPHASGHAGAAAMCQLIEAPRSSRCPGGSCDVGSRECPVFRVAVRAKPGFSEKFPLFRKICIGS